MKPTHHDAEGEREMLVSRPRSFGLTAKMVADWNKLGAEGKSIRYEAKDWLAMDRKQFNAILAAHDARLLDEVMELVSLYTEHYDMQENIRDVDELRQQLSAMREKYGRTDNKAE